jgi:formylglycine-generating enzyme required for sulfatase activity
MTVPLRTHPRRTSPRPPGARAARPGRREGAVVSVALVLAAVLLSTFATAQPRVEIPAATYLPFYPVQGEGAHAVPAFELQAHAVTNAAYLAFVEAHPAWRRGAVPEVFADPGYLRHWADATDLGDAAPDAPVTNVSWFAAGAYCAAQGLRLPTEHEWEVAARADTGRADASADPRRRAELLAAYARRDGPPGPVAQGAPNHFGAYDLHGLVWEWVEDPWSGLAHGDSRTTGDRDVARVCGGASLGARDRSDYPAFLRHAVRTGLEPASLNGSLGFRCAR